MEHIHISKGNSKLGVIPSVSLPAIITCRPDAPCKKLCYATHGRCNFQHHKDLMQHNLDVWRASPDVFEADVKAYSYFARYFRYFVSGDIPDMEFLKMMYRVALACPDTKYLAFTKKYEMVDDLVGQGYEPPDNLSILYSAWGSFQPENPHNFPVCYVRFKDGASIIPPNAHECGGHCANCTLTHKSCWDLKRGVGDCVVINQH